MMRGEESLKGVYLCVDACVITDRREGKKQGKRRRRRMRSLVEGRERRVVQLQRGSSESELIFFFCRCNKTNRCLITLACHFFTVVVEKGAKRAEVLKFTSFLTRVYYLSII